MNKRYRLGEIEEAVSEMEELIDTFHSSQRDNLCYTRFLQPLQFAEAVSFSAMASRISLHW